MKIYKFVAIFALIGCGGPEFIGTENKLSNNGTAGEDNDPAGEAGETNFAGTTSGGSSSAVAGRTSNGGSATGVAGGSTTAGSTVGGAATGGSTTATAGTTAVSTGGTSGGIGGDNAGGMNEAGSAGTSPLPKITCEVANNRCPANHEQGWHTTFECSDRTLEVPLELTDPEPNKHIRNCEPVYYLGDNTPTKFWCCSN